MPHVGSLNSWLKQRAIPSFVAFSQDIKLAHTVFALPFAAAALLILPTAELTMTTAVLLLVCMIAARSFAMGFNRLADATIDGQNARTARRAIPTGRLSRREAAYWLVFFGGLFCLAAAAINPLAGYLSLPLLGVLALYSVQKHLGWMCHWYLGFCLGLAPVGVNVALTGNIEIPIIILAVAVTFWTGGFDVIYATQDVSFDRNQGLKSAPVRFGVRRSIYLSRFSFGMMVLALTALGWWQSYGLVYFAGVVMIAAVLFWEQYLVRDLVTHGQTNRMTAAFFNANASVSLLFFLLLALEVSL